MECQPVSQFGYRNSSKRIYDIMLLRQLRRDADQQRKYTGTAIMQGVAVVFAAQAFGIHLTMTDYITVIGTATLASIGTAGVPSVGLVTLTMVFNSVGLPVEAIGLIMGIDRILDMTRTAVNITGDAVCTTIVAHQNKAIDRSVLENAQ